MRRQFHCFRLNEVIQFMRGAKAMQYRSSGSISHRSGHPGRVLQHLPSSKSKPYKNKRSCLVKNKLVASLCQPILLGRGGDKEQLTIRATGSRPKSNLDICDARTPSGSDLNWLELRYPRTGPKPSISQLRFQCYRISIKRRASSYYRYPRPTNRRKT